jgi:hypothetical protein
MAAAQERTLPFLRDVKTDVVLTFDPATRIYEYVYSVANGASSIGDLDWFEIDIKRDSVSVELDSEGLRFSSARIERSYRRTIAKLLQKTVPVSFPSLPRFGDALLSTNGNVAFSAKAAKPGERLSGLVMASKGLPGVRRFVARPLYDPNDYYPSVDDVSEEEAQRIVAQVDSDRVRIVFSGYTIGPATPPADFKRLAFCDTLISYKHQAFKLGWITNKGILNSLDQKLDNGRKQLERGNNKSAKNILQAFINEVEAQKDKHLSSEAYALLKFNAEYLISKLQ